MGSILTMGRHMPTAFSFNITNSVIAIAAVIVVVIVVEIAEVVVEIVAVLLVPLLRPIIYNSSIEVEKLEAY